MPTYVIVVYTSLKEYISYSLLVPPISSLFPSISPISTVLTLLHVCQILMRTKSRIVRPKTGEIQDYVSRANLFDYSLFSKNSGLVPSVANITPISAQIWHHCPINSFVPLRPQTWTLGPRSPTCHRQCISTKTRLVGTLYFSLQSQTREYS